MSVTYESGIVWAETMATTPATRAIEYLIFACERVGSFGFACGVVALLKVKSLRAIDRGSGCKGGKTEDEGVEVFRKTGERVGERRL